MVQYVSVRVYSEAQSVSVRDSRSLGVYIISGWQWECTVCHWEMGDEPQGTVSVSESINGEAKR